MRRSLQPYLEALEAFTAGRDDPSTFRTRVIQRFIYADAGVYWSREWDQDVADALARMAASAEVYVPGTSNSISLDELKQDAHDILRRLSAAIGRVRPEV
jgi:hypothetical protein